MAKDSSPEARDYVQQMGKRESLVPWSNTIPVSFAPSSALLGFSVHGASQNPMNQPDALSKSQQMDLIISSSVLIQTSISGEMEQQDGEIQ